MEVVRANGVRSPSAEEGWFAYITLETLVSILWLERRWEERCGV